MGSHMYPSQYSWNIQNDASSIKGLLDFPHSMTWYALFREPFLHHIHDMLDGVTVGSNNTRTCILSSVIAHHSERCTPNGHVWSFHNHHSLRVSSFLPTRGRNVGRGARDSMLRGKRDHEMMNLSSRVQSNQSNVWSKKLPPWQPLSMRVPTASFIAVWHGNHELCHIHTTSKYKPKHHRALELLSGTSRGKALTAIQVRQWMWSTFAQRCALTFPVSKGRPLNIVKLKEHKKEVAGLEAGGPAFVTWAVVTSWRGK